jgi:hypothetical protein
MLVVYWKRLHNLQILIRYKISGHFWKKNRKCKCSSRQLLIENLKEKWDKMGQEVTANLVNSMPRRLQAVIDAKGLHTKY